MAIPGFDAITLELDQHGKLKGKRLTDAVAALNALGGTWHLVRA